MNFVRQWGHCTTTDTTDLGGRGGVQATNGILAPDCRPRNAEATQMICRCGLAHVVSAIPAPAPSSLFALGRTQRFRHVPTDPTADDILFVAQPIAHSPAESMTV